MEFFPENISSFGDSIDGLWKLVTIISVIVFLIVQAILFYSILKFRRQKGVKAAYIDGSFWGQAKWVLIPVAIVALLDFFIDTRTHSVWNEVKGQMPQAELRLRIIGVQYAWLVTYPGPDKVLDTDDDYTLTNELHIPKDKTVVFDLQARDVLHSLWIPVMRYKQDAVPGRTIQGWFKAIKSGQYEIACAELCGDGHSRMRADLFVHEAADYDAWENKIVEQIAKEDAAFPGKKVLRSKGCTACHTLDGQDLIGPSFKGIWGRKTTVITNNGQEKELIVDEAYIRTCVEDPNIEVVKGYAPMMTKLDVSEEEMTAIIEYLKTLKNGN